MRDDRTEAEEPAGSGLGAIGMGKRDWEIDREVEINAQSSELRGPKTQNQSVLKADMAVEMVVGNGAIRGAQTARPTPIGRLILAGIVGPIASSKISS